MTSIFDLLDILFSRRIIVFGGEFGRSKTLSSAAYCYIAWLYNNVHTFVTNSPLTFKGANRFVNIKPLLTTDEFEKEYRDTIFFVDEMQDNFDARDFMSPKIRYITHWAKDLRKHNCQIVGTIQYFDFLEMRAAQLLQIIIIPSFINTYHNNDKKDIQMRLEAKDFNVSWYILDRKVNKEYEFELNLYPYLGMYLTKFRPAPLVANHPDYLRYLKQSKGEAKYKLFTEDMVTQLNYSSDNFNHGLVELGLPTIEVHHPTY